LFHTLNRTRNFSNILTTKQLILIYVKFILKALVGHHSHESHNLDLSQDHPDIFQHHPDSFQDDPDSFQNRPDPFQGHPDPFQEHRHPAKDDLHPAKDHAHFSQDHPSQLFIISLSDSGLCS